VRYPCMHNIVYIPLASSVFLGPFVIPPPISIPRVKSILSRTGATPVVIS
jgi:hypothetical protein